MSEPQGGCRQVRNIARVVLWAASMASVTNLGQCDTPAGKRALLTPCWSWPVVIGRLDVTTPGGSDLTT